MREWIAHGLAVHFSVIGVLKTWHLANCRAEVLKVLKGPESSEGLQVLKVQKVLKCCVWASGLFFSYWSPENMASGKLSSGSVDAIKSS